MGYIEHRTTLILGHRFAGCQFGVAFRHCVGCLRIGIILGMKVRAELQRRHALRAATLSLWTALAAAVCLALAACDGEDALLVFAATSLRDPLTRINESYESETGAAVNLSFGASQSLAQQIASGAPADVFISAGAAPVDFLQERDLIPNDDARRLLGNELVIVMLDNNPEIDSLESLTSDTIERLALADPALAPAGAYAKEALLSVGIWDGLQDKLLLGKDVRAAMTYVEVGNADAGIVYRTDALSSDSLRVVHAVEAALHSPIVYPAVALSDSSNREEVSKYLNYLSSEEAIAVFRRFGFSDPPPK